MQKQKLQKEHLHLKKEIDFNSLTLEQKLAIFDQLTEEQQKATLKEVEAQKNAAVGGGKKLKRNNLQTIAKKEAGKTASFLYHYLSFNVWMRIVIYQFKILKFEFINPI